MIFYSFSLQNIYFVFITIQIDKYTPVGEIGKGGYGSVYQAKDINNNLYAIKKIELYEKEEGIKNSTLRECAISAYVKSPFIVECKEMCPDIEQNQIFLIYEFGNMDLRQYIRNYYKLGISEQTIKIITYQILRGLQDFHATGLIHRDMKPHNTLLFQAPNGQYRCKIIDFGLSRSYICQPTQMSTSSGTKFFMTPEMMLGYSNYNQTVDTFAVGLIMSQLFSNRYIFPCRDNDEGILKMMQIMGSPKGELLRKYQQLPRWTSRYENYPGSGWQEYMTNASDQARDLFLKLINFDWDQRLTAEQALQHPWFQGIDDNTLF